MVKCQRTSGLNAVRWGPRKASCSNVRFLLKICHIVTSLLLLDYQPFVNPQSTAAINVAKNFNVSVNMRDYYGS